MKNNNKIIRKILAFFKKITDYFQKKDILVGCYRIIR